LQRYFSGLIVGVGQTMQVSLNLDVLGIEKLAWLRSNRYDPCHPNRTLKLVDSATRLHQIYYRFLETEDEYCDYAPAPTPPQGRWCIDGLGLPEDILRKICYENAERLVEIELKL
jgi:hypothetical protein